MLNLETDKESNPFPAPPEPIPHIVPNLEAVKPGANPKLPVYCLNSDVVSVFDVPIVEVVED